MQPGVLCPFPLDAKEFTFLILQLFAHYHRLANQKKKLGCLPSSSRQPFSPVYPTKAIIAKAYSVTDNRKKHSAALNITPTSMRLRSLDLPFCNQPIGIVSTRRDLALLHPLLDSIEDRFRSKIPRLHLTNQRISPFLVPKTDQQL